MDISGTVALVTGANRGIGAALVDALIQAGASKVYAGTRTQATVQPGSKIVPIALDITNAAQVAAAVKACGDVQILVNNAGISLSSRLVGAADPRASEREMAVNYFGTLSMIRAFAPVLGRNGGGAIVNILSILSRINMPLIGSYSASKAAAFSMTQAVRAELAAQGTLVVGVMPAFVDTDMAKRVTQAKLPPSAVAHEAIEALRNGIEDVYPGPAAGLAAQFQADPKAVEKQFAAMLALPASA